MENQVNQQVADLLDKHDLFWKVEAQPLYFGDGVRAGFQGTRRMDTMDDPAMGSFKSYTPFQNWELVELILKVSEEYGTEIEKVGQFDGGAKLYFQMPLNETKIGGNDQVNSFLTAINSHDGSTKLRWGTCSTVISCRNTFQHAYGQLQNSIMHTASMKEKIKATITHIDKVKEAEKVMIEQFLELSKIPVIREDVVKVVHAVTGVDSSKTGMELKADHSTKAVNKATELLASIEAEIKSKGSTKWGLFNGVTHFTTHRHGRNVASRAKSKVLGASLRIDNKIFEMLIS